MTHRSHGCIWRLLAFMLLLLPGQQVHAQPHHSLPERIVTPENRPPHVLQIHELTTGQIRAINIDATAAIPNSGMLAFRLEGEPELVALPPSNRDKLWRLPFAVVQITEVTGIKQTLRCEALLVGGWLMAEGEVLSGTLKLRLADLENPNSQAPLEQPISIVVSASPGETSPTDLIIKKANTFTDVEISTSLDPHFVKVNIIPAFDATPIRLRVPVMRHIALAASPAKVQGFGLESARIEVSINPPPKNPVTVKLSSNSGKPSPAEVIIIGAEAQYVTLRSQGTGTALLKAKATMTTGNSLEVSFDFPLSFLVAALIGGMIGSVLKARNRKDHPGKPSWVSFIISGLLVGYIAAMAVMLGVNPFLINFAAEYGEALVVVVSCLGAYVGSPLIDRMARLRS